MSMGLLEGGLEKAKQLQDNRRQAQDERRVLDEARHVGIEYRVDELRESLIGGKHSGDALARLLNQRAAEGWAFKQLVETDVKGRVGPGGVGGLLAIFERSRIPSI